MASGEKPQSRFTEVQGIKLHYLEWGETGKPDLLLVHGWTSFASSWSTVAEYFRDRFHIIAPDLRGHGDSDKPQTGYRLRDFTEDVRRLIKNLELRKPAYVGHSWAVTSARSWHRMRRILFRGPSLKIPSSGACSTLS